MRPKQKPKPKPIASMWVYPRDLVDDSPEMVVKRAKEMGLDALSLTAVYHTGRVVLPHNRRRRIWFPEDGVAYFRPDESRYGRLVPPVARLAHDGDLIGDTVSVAQREGIQVAIWTVCLHNGALGHAHPEVTLENAFGDKMLNCLCPNNPDVREYLFALLCDLSSRYGPSAFDLESVAFMPWEPAFQIEIANIPIGHVLRFLLSLCFCPVCMAEGAQRGIDGTRLREWVQAEIDRALAGSHVDESAFWELLPTQVGGDMGAWFKMRQDTVTKLYKELAEALGSDGPQLLPTLFAPPQELWESGIDLSELASILSGALVNCYRGTPEDVSASWKTYDNVCGRDWENFACLRVGPGFLDSPVAVQSVIAQLRKENAAGYRFYNYGIMSNKQLEWIGDTVGNAK